MEPSTSEINPPDTTTLRAPPHHPQLVLETISERNTAKAMSPSRQCSFPYPAMSLPKSLYFQAVTYLFFSLLQNGQGNPRPRGAGPLAIDRGVAAASRVAAIANPLAVGAGLPAAECLALLEGLLDTGLGLGCGGSVGEGGQGGDDGEDGLHDEKGRS
ncbi:hypothetical protein VUR80DRAFT_9487 [Thermomyces stellatus]